MNKPLSTASCDLLVIGSGAAGATAAITARSLGMDVILAEKTSLFGGTAALSGGWIWIPGNAVAARAGVEDSGEAAREYLAHEAGSSFDAERVDAFLAEGPRMVEFMERCGAAEFVSAPAFPDYHPNIPGSSSGRSICAAPFDARKLGSHLARLRPPLPEMCFLGMAISSGSELRHFQQATRSLRSAAFVAGRLASHARDLLTNGRSMRLTNGNALAARLLKKCIELEVSLWFDAPAKELTRAGDAVQGALFVRDGAAVRVEARRGVVLASGGFSHDAPRRAALVPFAAGPDHWAFAPDGNTGDGLRMGEAVGGSIDGALSDLSAWAPMSRFRRRDGSVGSFAHIVDRAKPGVIAVTASGKRFVNEANCYHDFVQALVAACRGRGAVEAFLLCDHRTLRRYGLGLVKPFPIPISPYIRSGYLARGQSLAELAAQLSIEGAALENTVAMFNQRAREGRDSDFGKGQTIYNRYMGDEDADNPCLAPIEYAPFYAVKVIPGSLGTYAGLRCDRYGRVLRQDKHPIRGLYAVGSDMNHLMGGSYPAGGTNLGPHMTFGFIAAHHAATENC